MLFLQIPHSQVCLSKTPINVHQFTSANGLLVRALLHQTQFQEHLAVTPTISMEAVLLILLLILQAPIL